MGILFWKNNKIIDEFAISISDEIYSQILPEVMKKFFAKELDKKEQARVEKKMRIYEDQIYQFRVTRKLGVYGKARLQLTFMERLEALGYPKELIKKLNEYILVKVA